MTARTGSIARTFDALRRLVSDSTWGEGDMTEAFNAQDDLSALLDTLARVTEERDALRKFIGSRVWPNLDHASAAISGDEWANCSLALMEVAEQLADIAMECRAALREGGAK